MDLSAGGRPRLPREASAETSRPCPLLRWTPPCLLQPKSPLRSSPGLLVFPAHRPFSMCAWMSESESDPQLVPTAQRHRSHRMLTRWCKQYAGQPIVVACQNGGTLSQAAAASLRHEGIDAQTLVGGYEAWRAEHATLVSERRSRSPRRRRPDGMGNASPTKVVRVACPWLIRRFIDPNAVFLFVPSAEVAGVAEHAKAAPFDVEGAFWADRGEQHHVRCHARRVRSRH